MSADSPISKAFNYVKHHPLEDDVRVMWGTREMFDYHISMIIDEQFKIDIHDKRITHNEIAQAVKDILFDMKRDQVVGDLANDIDSAFNNRKGEALSELLRGTLTEYTLTFPLNLGLIQPYIDELSVLEADFQPVEQEEWVDEYFEVAKAEDDGFLKKFLQVSPNDFLDDQFAYFEIQYEARSEGYALARVQDLANLAVGQLNSCIHQRSRAPSRPSNGTALPYETWAALKEPAFYLVFDKNEYLFPRPMDYGYRRVIGTSERRKQDVLDFYSLPELSEGDPVDTDLINGILAYQDGMTEPSKRKSFFSFWRGIENLSQVASPKHEVKERSRFALEHMRG